MAFDYLIGKTMDDESPQDRRIEPRMGPEPGVAQSDVFDSGRRTIVDCAHVRVERLDTYPVLFSKVFKEFQDPQGQKYDYRYWAERENFFLREFLKKQGEFSHVVQARHLISENEAAKQVLTCDAGITIANWLRVKSRYNGSATLSHPFQQWDAFLRLIRACLVALKQIHQHRIVHCDIKEDNICIPYEPNPYRGDGRKIHIEYEKLKLIDFAFSIAHAIPLTQVLIINPDEPLPYQSRLLISALHADRRNGSPNAVQQLDSRVDLYSLGHMAGKIGAAGLVGPRASHDSGILDEIARLVQTLKAFESAPQQHALPHDGLIAHIDTLLPDGSGHASLQEFSVDGEWSTEDMEQGRGAARKTPLTPVALPVPTPVALPIARPARAPGAASRFRIISMLAIVLALAGGILLYREGGELRPQPDKQADIAASPHAGREPSRNPSPPVINQAMQRIALQLRDDEDLVFQAASGDLARLVTETAPGAAELAAAVAAEYGDVLASDDTVKKRQRAFARLAWMAREGNSVAAERVAAFEKSYDEVKQVVAKSSWWVRGEGTQPVDAAKWIANGGLLSENGDRPAMLDYAFALGHGRALPLDRAASVETYYKLIERSAGGDRTSARIRLPAMRGLAAMLNAIVEAKDQEAAKRLLLALEARAAAGAHDLQYFMGLFSECVMVPANPGAARLWYRRAAEDPAWKNTAERKARSLGSWCPRPPA